VLRIAGEAASNVVRHAQARAARVSLKLNDGLIELEIADDGAGLPKPSRGGGLGLNHIRARAEKLGGELRVDAAPGRGTRISVAFPPSRA
jgi:signal transduction histidine kinase